MVFLKELFQTVRLSKCYLQFNTPSSVIKSYKNSRCNRFFIYTLSFNTSLQIEQKTVQISIKG